MFIPILLTPLMLATDPVLLQMPDRTYDHQAQVSTFDGELTNVLKARMTYINTQTFSSRHSDTDTNTDTAP